MDRTVDFELGIYRHQNADIYNIDLRFALPDDEVDVRVSCAGPTLDELGADNFLEYQLDMEKYGELLAQHIFANQEVRKQYWRARTYADADGRHFRMRLFIDQSASELHALRWETLRLPSESPDGPGNYVSIGGRVLFSRYISSRDTRPVRPRPKSELRVLVVIANPSNLKEYGLAPIDVDAELSQVHAGVGKGAKIEQLTSPGEATLGKVMAKLRDEYDILYIVCHGKQHVTRRGQPGMSPMLVLEDENSEIELVSARDFVTHLRELQVLPKLVVLASCGSAGSGEAVKAADTSALAMLGPRLADTGVPAVIAMQGLISMKTVAIFMPVFFEELRKDGLVDRAMAAARHAIRKRHDWWAPTLMMRLQRGQIWYTPGFDRESSTSRQWPDLKRDLKEKRCTPILGPGLGRSFLGSRRQIAREWADRYRYPMAPHERDDLPQVCQFISTKEDPRTTRDRLRRYLTDKLVAQVTSHDVKSFPPDLREKALSASGEDIELSALYSLAWKIASHGNPEDPHRTLAQLNAPLYITTQYSDLLYEALVEAGREPRQEICRWLDFYDAPRSVYETEPDYLPSAQEPLIFHVFGRMKYPETLVLSEDDYFQYLMGVTVNKELIPEYVRQRLTNSKLLFLGFRMESWDFRVLFNSLKQHGGFGERGYKHIAAQVNLDEGAILEPQGARDHLERYFNNRKVSIYWGQVEEFVSDLHKEAPQLFQNNRK